MYFLIHRVPIFAWQVFKMSWSAFICELCTYILVWTLSMSLCRALYIVCQHVYVHSIALWAPDGLSVGIPPVYIQFYFARLRSNREPGVYYSQYVLTTFLFAGFKSVRYILPDYVGLGPKLHTCIYLQFMCITWIWMQQVKSVFIHTQYQLNQYLISVSIFYDSATIISFQLITCWAL